MEEKILFADIIPDVSVKSLDKPFQYKVPQDMAESIRPGSVVKIGFGKGDRVIKGYVINLSYTPKYDIKKTKELKCFADKDIDVEGHLLSLAYYIKRNYGGTLRDALKVVMPVKRTIKNKMKRRLVPLIGQDEMAAYREELLKKRKTAQARVIDALLENATDYDAGVDYDLAVKNHRLTTSAINPLSDKGIIKIDADIIYRQSYKKIETQKKHIILNDMQSRVINRICGDYDHDIRNIYLLHGVTGSGKTEVYMRCMEHVIKQDKQVIVLIPEIALTYQIIKEFYGRFGDRVGVIHSRLSSGERYDQFQKAKNGELDVVIGPRSAVFTPFKNLGMIIVDEEHETGYQSESVPKYNATDVAIKRAQMLGAGVILGSATPSVGTYTKALRGEYVLLTLSERAVSGAVMPEIDVVDLREELKNRNYSIFSRRLDGYIKECLERKEQIMLFINRRGYAGFVSCRECGKPVGCPHCSVALKPHMVRKKVSYLLCHYCGYSMPMPDKCPECGSGYIGTFGVGTEQIEQEVKKRYPQAVTLRMDADTTGGKEGHDKIIKAFREKKADILIGTQMIVKGHDFENVTLVGILAADLSLNINDFRAAERTYQLLAQAAGRAGRGRKAGRAVIQTYRPEHYSITSVVEQNYLYFYEKEISVRKMLQYPPISNILEMLIFSKDEKKTEEIALRIKDIIISGGIKYDKILGPAQANLSKIKDNYRMVIYIKSHIRDNLCDIKDIVEKYMLDENKYKECFIQFEFN